MLDSFLMFLFSFSDFFQLLIISFFLEKHIFPLHRGRVSCSASLVPLVTFPDFHATIQHLFIIVTFMCCDTLNSRPVQPRSQVKSWQTEFIYLQATTAHQVHTWLLTILLSVYV